MQLEQVADVLHEVTSCSADLLRMANLFIFLSGCYSARPVPESESCGEHGLGFDGRGIDHGVFIAFRIMFRKGLMDILILELSMDRTKLYRNH